MHADTNTTKASTRSTWTTTYMYARFAARHKWAIVETKCCRDLVADINNGSLAFRDSNAMPRAPSSRSATPTVPDALRPTPINTSFDTSRGRTPLRKATAFGGTYVVPEANSRRQTPLREPTPKRDDRWL